MKWFWVVLILLLFFVFKMDFNKNNTNETLENKIFDCQSFDFTFQFPDFKDWEFKNTEEVRENLCVMYFNWPDDVEYEYPPQISVEKIDLKDKSEKAKQNSQGIYYEYITDSSLYTDGHKFEEGDWDWLVFYGKDYSVRISRNMFGEPPFDADQFYKKIIDTFDFK